MESISSSQYTHMEDLKSFSQGRREILSCYHPLGPPPMLLSLVCAPTTISRFPAPCQGPREQMGHDEYGFPLSVYMFRCCLSEFFKDIPYFYAMHIIQIILYSKKNAEDGTPEKDWKL